MKEAYYDDKGEARCSDCQRKLIVNTKGIKAFLYCPSCDRK